LITTSRCAVSCQSWLRTSPCSSTAQSPLNTTVSSWSAEESQGIHIMLRNSVASFNIGRKVSRCGALAMAQEVSLRPLTAMARVRSQASHVWLIVNTCHWERTFPSGFGFRLSVSFYQCTKLIYSFTHLASTLHNLSYWECHQIRYNLENCWGDYGGSEPS
jgi:hypothetical protein